jgi:RNA polymerase sigma-70 factor (ECF subfamily)
MQDGMDAHKTDRRLVNRIIARDPLALSELYDTFGRLVFSVALRILGNSESAEEVTQDVFIQIWEKAATFDPQLGNLSTWIASIARNRAIDRIRRHRVRPDESSLAWDDCCEDNPDSQAMVEPVLITSDQRRSLILALQTLPEEQKKALAMAYFQGMTQQEIALALHEPLGTIKTRIRLALMKLRAVLHHEFEDD